MATAVTTPGILLRSYPYSESSKILRFLTPGHGLVSLIGKGVRSRRFRTDAPLQTFAEGVLTFSQRSHRDLHTLQDFRQSEGAMALGKEVQRFVGASLWAEILLAHTLEGGDDELYHTVREGLSDLASVATDEVPPRILAGGWRILALLGFPPELGECVVCGDDLVSAMGESGLGRFDVTGGGALCPSCSVGRGSPRIGPGALAQLRAFSKGQIPAISVGIGAHLGLLESFASYHVGGRIEFRSFAVLRSVWKGDGSDFP